MGTQKEKDGKARLTSLERSWILYDVGNSAYTMLACSLLPIFFKKLAIGEGPGMLTSDQATGYLALVISIVTVITAILGPIVGTFSDYQGKKKK